MIRQIEDERHRLRLHNTKLEQLVAATNLSDRETLTKQLDTLQVQFDEGARKLSVSWSHLGSP